MIYVIIYFPVICISFLIWLNNELSASPRKSVVLPILLHFAMGAITAFILEQFLEFIFLWAWALEISLFCIFGLLLIKEQRKKIISENEGQESKGSMDLNLPRVFLFLMFFAPIGILIHTWLNLADFLNGTYLP